MFYCGMQDESREILQTISDRVYKFFCIDIVSKYNQEEREGQQNMALDIADVAILNNKHFMIEAGVGIGKTFAYLVPLMYYHRIFSKPIAIATSTIALQHQLERDIAFISQLMGCNCNITLAKGYKHYICLKRVKRYFKNQPNNILNEIKTGIFDRNNFSCDIPDNIWNEINVTYEQQLCRDCTDIMNCRFKTIRQEMKTTSGFIICNQDLLTTHLDQMMFKQQESPLLSKDIRFVVVDEAHNLEDKIRSHFTRGYSCSQINRIIWKTAKQHNKNSRISVIANNAQHALKKIYSVISNVIEKQRREINDEYVIERFSIDVSVIKDNVLYIYKLLDELSIITSYYEQEYLSNSPFGESIEEVMSFFYDMYYLNDNEILWVESKQRGDEVLFSCPKNIATKTQQLYFSNQFTTILTSATLANKNSNNDLENYSYTIKNIGFPVENGGYNLTRPQQSPFSYDKNCMLYCADDLPHPRNEHQVFIKMATERLIELLNISKGKALVLFTAKKDLEEVRKQLSGRQLPYNILFQDTSSSQSKIIDSFKKDIHSILLGTGTYWEGLDIPGETLSNVVIFRLPFPVPDPIIQYKTSLAKNGLMEVNVPMMIIKLKQGIGRLIRKKDDKGIISILDPRLGAKAQSPYRDIVLDAIPIKNITTQISVLEDFYNKLYPNSQ